MRLTASGWGTLTAGVGLYALGVVLGFPELTVAGAALLMLLVAAVGWVLRPPTLEVSRQLEPVRVRRGNPSLGLVRILNAAHRRAPGLAVEDRAGDQRVALDVPALSPGREFASTYRLPTDRRGIFDVGPLVLSQTDPFGLVARRRPFGEVARLWVHPRSHPVPAARSGSTVEMDGPMDETAPEGTIAFQGLRPYIVGDDLRLVHWRTTARAGTLMVKKHVDTNRPQVVVLLDDRAASYLDHAGSSGHSGRSGHSGSSGSSGDIAPARFEQAVEVAASLLEQAVRAGAPVRLDTVGGAGRGLRPRAAPGTPSTSWLDLQLQDLRRPGTGRSPARGRSGEARRSWLPVTTSPDDPSGPRPFGRPLSPGERPDVGRGTRRRCAPVRAARGLPGGRGRGGAGPLAVGRPDMSATPWAWARYIPAIPASLTVMAAGCGFQRVFTWADTAGAAWTVAALLGGGAGCGGARRR